MPLRLIGSARRLAAGLLFDARRAGDKAALARKCLDARVEDCRAWKKEISRPRGGVVWVVVPPVAPPAEGGQSPAGEGIGGTAALAQKCLDAKGVGCEAWEKEIDERVAALYGL